MRPTTVPKPAGPLLAVLASVLFLVSCARPGTESAGNDPARLPLPGPLSWVAGQAGLLALPGPGESVEAGGRIGAFSARESDEGSLIEVGLDGWGLAAFAPALAGKALRFTQEAVAELRGLRVGGLWPYEGGFLLQSYRDPFVAFQEGAPEPGSEASSMIPALLKVGLPSEGSGSTSSLLGGWLSSEAARGLELFALLPDPRGGWLAQLRTRSETPVRSSFLAFPGLSEARPRELSRADFEGALAPRPLATAPYTMKAALASLLGPSALDSSEALLVRHSGPDGLRTWFSRGGDLGSARELFAWTGASGASLVLDAEGELRLARSGGGAPLALHLPAPLPGARYSDACFVPLGDASGGFLVAGLWEAVSGAEGRRGLQVSGITLAPCP